MNKNRSKEPILFFSKMEEEQIVAAIRAAELKTSGEIRVHLERSAKGDILQRAKETFERLGMTLTQERNGVLIFLSTASRQFAIIGDEGIHKQLPPSFWEVLAHTMTRKFQENRFADGIVAAIAIVGERLGQAFPRQPSDVNELPDAISYSL